MDATHLATVAKFQEIRGTATDHRTAVKVGHRSFFWEGDQLMVLSFWGRATYACKCTEEQGVALARNMAHIVGASAGRGYKRFQIVMGSGR